MTRASQDQRGKEALLGIEVPSLASQVVGAALQRGPAYLELSIRHVPRSGLEDLRSAVDFARSCSPTLAIGIGVQDPGAADRDMYTRIGSLIDHVEPDIIRVSTADTDDDSIERAVELSEWIRLVRQRATILDAGLGARDARTALLAGRADLVVLDPPAVALGELDIALARFLAAVEAVPRTRWHDGAPDAWSITEILGHVAEMLPYWAREAADVAAPQGEEPFGRTHDDPERIAAVERARSVRPDLAIGAIEPAVAATQEHLYRISPAGWAQTGRHARRGQMSALAIVRVFLVDHLLEHADQVEARSTAGPR